MNKFASKAVAMAFLKGDIDVPTPNFIYNIVVGKCLNTLLLLTDLIKVLLDFVG